MASLIAVSATHLSAAEFAEIHQKQEQLRYPEAVRQRQVAPSVPPQRISGWLWGAGWVLLLALGIWFGPKPLQPYLRLALLSAVVTAVGLAYRRREYWRAYRQSPTARLHTSFLVQEDGVVVEQKAGHTAFLWTELHRIQQIKHWLLLYPNIEYCYYLDLRNVVPPATATDLLGMLAEKKFLTP